MPIPFSPPDTVGQLSLRRMPLDGSAQSPEAIALVAAFAKRVQHSPFITQPDTVPAIAAALLCDLLRTAGQDPMRWGRIFPEESHAFDKGAVKQLVAAARALNFVERQKFSEAADPGFGKDRAIRLRATPWLFALADEHGIRPASWRHHFSVPKPDAATRADPALPAPLQLKALSRNKKGRLFIGEEIAIDPADREAQQLADEIRALETYLQGQALRPFGFAHLRRAFYRLGDQRLGDPPGDWSLGGRISALGAANFQGVRASRRTKMRINGAPVVEIDIVASGLTILHGLSGQALDLSRDPYAFDGLPRAVTKACIVEAFGPPGLPRAWPRRIAHDLHMASERQLEKRHPIAAVRTRVLERFPLLAEPPVDWATIQFAESSLLMATLTRLAFQRDIPALPVHDSLIVRLCDVDLAAAVLAEEFRNRVGLHPRLRRSDTGD